MMTFVNFIDLDKKTSACSFFLAPLTERVFLQVGVTSSSTTRKQKALLSVPTKKQ